MTKEAFVALVTCFNDDETINFDATRAQVLTEIGLTPQEVARRVVETVARLDGRDPGELTDASVDEQADRPS